MDYNDSFIFIKPTRYPEESFYYFIKNSSIRLLSDSSAFGFVYRCQFKKPAKKSPYFYLNSKGDTKDVITIVIKCLLVNDRISNDSDSYGDDNNHYWEYKRTHDKISKRHFDMQERFLEEVRKQTLISKKGLVAMNRNCPVVLFSKLYGDRSLKGKILGKILLKQCESKEDKITITKMLGELSFRHNIPQNTDQVLDRSMCEIMPGKLEYYFGVLAMENIDTDYCLFNDIVKPIIIDDIIAYNPELYKYDSLALSPYSERLRWAYNTARYELLRMALDTGYSQADYHTDNILINEKTRKTIIIDFGRCKKIVNHKGMLDLWNHPSTSTISDKSSLCSNKSNKQFKPDFYKLLKILFYSTFSDEKRHDEFMWIKGIDEEDTDILFFLHKMHNASLERERIDGLYDMMNDTNTYNGICTTDNISGTHKNCNMWKSFYDIILCR